MQQVQDFSQGAAGQKAKAILSPSLNSNFILSTFCCCVVQITRTIHHIDLSDAALVLQAQRIILTQAVKTRLGQQPQKYFNSIVPKLSKKKAGAPGAVFSDPSHSP